MFESAGKVFNYNNFILLVYNSVFNYSHCVERWLPATPKRWRIVRSHDNKKIMGVASGRSFPGGILCSNIYCIYIYIWVPDESYSSPKGHHQVGASPIGYQCLVILHTCVLYSATAGSSAIDLVMLFFVRMVASNNHSDVEEEDEEEELFASSSWLYVWRFVG